MSNMTMQELYHRIKSDIVSMQVGNAIISEQKMADRYGTTKLNAREALALLCHEGYLDKYPRQGYVVRPIYQNEFNEVVQVKNIIELAAAEIIIDNCTDDEIKSLYAVAQQDNVTVENFHEYNRRFHVAFVGLAKNETMSRIHNNLLYTSSRPGRYYYTSYPLKLMEDHVKIVDALLTRDRRHARDVISKANR